MRRAYSGRHATMPLHDLPLILVTRHLGDVHVGGALLLDEVLALHAKPERVAAFVRELAKEILSKTAPLEIHRRMPGPTPQLSRLPRTVQPPKKSLAWTEPITLHLDVLRWRHGDEASIAYLPPLDIQVVAARDEQLDDLIVQHARVALARAGATEKLFDLIQLARIESVSIEREQSTADISTPAQIAADRTKEQAPAPVIDEAGNLLDQAPPTPAYQLDALVDRLA